MPPALTPFPAVDYTSSLAGTLPPFTAWEQAVFVALFIFMVIGLLYWFSKQQASLQKSQQDAQKSQQDAADKRDKWFSEQQASWQEFINKRDEQWQAFLKEQRAADHNSIKDLVNEVKHLAQELVNLRGDFDAHDQMEREVLRNISKPKTPKS